MVGLGRKVKLCLQRQKDPAHKRRSACPLPSKSSTVESTEIKCPGAADSFFSAAERGVRLEPTGAL